MPAMRAIVIVLCALLASCQGCEPPSSTNKSASNPPSPPTVRVSQKATDLPTNRILIGTGFNSATGEERSDCVVRGRLITVSDAANAPRTRYYLRQVTNMREFRNALNLSAAASFGWGIFGGSAASEYYSSGRFTNYNTFIIAKVTVLNEPEILESSRLTDEARRMASEGATSLIQYCGDEFVHKRQTGGEFAFIGQFSSSTTEQQEQVDRHVKAAVSAFIVSGEAEVGFKSAMTELTKLSEVTIDVLRVGDVSRVPDIKSVVEYAENFPTVIGTDRTRAATMLVMTRGMDTVEGLPRGARDFRSISAQRAVLDAYAEFLGDAQAIQGNLDYIRNHPGQFEAFDQGVLESERSKHMDQIRALREAAENCRRDVEACKKPERPTFTNFSVRRGNVSVPVVPPPPAVPPEPSWVQLDNSALNSAAGKLLGSVPAGESKTLEARGGWRPPGYNRCFGPTGDPNPDPRVLGNFGLEVKYTDADRDSQVVRDWAVYQGPTQTPQSVRVYVRMRMGMGLGWGRNSFCDPPMKVILY